jgi:hypothetical protein
MMKPMRSRRVHYGWIVVAAGFAALLAARRPAPLAVTA